MLFFFLSFEYLICIKFSARAWSHSTKDHFHDEWGFITMESNGNATLMTVGNNGNFF